MKKEIKNIDVKSLVNELNHEVVEGEILTETSIKRSRKRENDYEFMFCSGCDFALNRKTIRTNKTLVSILSQDILYIYDELKGTKREVTELKQLYSFFSDKKQDDEVIPAGRVNYMKKGIKKSELETWLNTLQKKDPTCKYIMKRGLVQISAFERNYAIEDLLYEMQKVYAKNPNILSYTLQKFPFIDGYTYRYREKQFDACLLSWINMFMEDTDADTTKYFIDQYAESSVYISTCDSEFSVKKYNLNARRFIDYMLFDFYKQGKKEVNIRTYKDYLEQQIQYFGRISEKYPKYFETEHQVLSMKINEKSRYLKDSPKFMEIMDECENFEYYNSIDKFRIIMPKQSSELVEEGIKLCHCVASYVEKVNNGDCIVVFMRTMDEPDEPYLTIEILPDRQVPQIEGKNRRRDLTEDEISFIERWVKNKHLKLTAENAVKKKGAA